MMSLEQVEVMTAMVADRARLRGELATVTSQRDDLALACVTCAIGLERDARMYPNGVFPNVSRFVNRAAALRRATDKLAQETDDE